MKFTCRTWVNMVAAAATLSLLPACTDQTRPQVAMPAPKPQPVPARPMPPFGASQNMVIPAVGGHGVRMTVNASLNTAETTWNLRSGMNVAALNCLSSRHAPILAAYSSMLKRHRTQFSSTNRALDSQFRKQYGTTYKRVRDGHMTKVYNYFSLPPVRARLCDAALDLSNAYMVAPPTDIDSYAAVALPKLEAAFEGFYREFEAYRTNVAAWDAKYGARYGYTQRSYASSGSYLPSGSQSAVSRPVIQGQATPATNAAVIDK